MSVQCVASREQVQYSSRKARLRWVLEVYERLAPHLHSDPLGAQRRKGGKGGPVIQLMKRQPLWRLERVGRCTFVPLAEGEDERGAELVCRAPERPHVAIVLSLREPPHCAVALLHRRSAGARGWAAT